ncbi:MAG: peptide ABC transporter substrate-binding protein [Phycisphaerales bacterium]
MRTILIAVLALLGVLVLGFAADRTPPRADLTIIDSQDFISLDPQRLSYMQDIRAVACLYETLTRNNIHSADFEVVPALASSWTISSDALTYSFHLRPTAKWSNADPVRASDFVYAWKRAMLPDTAADYSSLFMKIKGAEAFFAHRVESIKSYARRPAGERTPEAAARLREDSDAYFNQHVGLRAEGDHTLIVTLERPVAFFLDLVAFAAFAPVHPPTVEKYVGLDPNTAEIRQDHGWTKPPNVVTNGPFVMTQWRFKRDAFFEANPHYWDQSALRTKSVRIIPIEDQNTGVLAFKTGAADWHCDVNAEYIPEMLEQVRHGGRDDLAAFPTFGTYFWNFNCTKKLPDGRDNPFHDARVRRAFAMCVNKKDIVEKIKRGGERIANTLIPVGSIKGFQSPAGVGYDPDAARKLLEEAGWTARAPDGSPAKPPSQPVGQPSSLPASELTPFPVVTLLVTPIQHHKDVAQALGRMWEQTLGVRTQIEVRETKSFKEKLRNKDYIISRAGWWGDYGDPTTFLNLHKTNDGNNDRGYSNPKYDQLLEHAENETDPAKRMRILEGAERMTVNEELPVLPLWQYNFYYLFKPPEKNGQPNPGGLRGISTHPRLVQYYWMMEVVR